MTGVEKEFAIAKDDFQDFLKETVPAIIDKGNTLVWRGRYRDCRQDYQPYYRIVIERFGGLPGFGGIIHNGNSFKIASIDLDADNRLMRDWMWKHEKYIKGLLVMYCRAVWDLLDNGLLDRTAFDMTEDDVEFDDEEITEEERRKAAEEEAEAERYRYYCEQKYGWDCS